MAALSITDISYNISPAILTDKIVITVSVYNSTSSTVNDAALKVYMNDESYGYMMSSTFSVGGKKTVVYEFTIDGDYPSTWTTYIANVLVGGSMKIYACRASSTETSNVAFGPWVADTRFNLAIDKFEVRRTSDESTTVLTTLKISCNGNLTTAQKQRIKLTLIATDSSGNEIWPSLTYSSIDSLITGVTDSSTLITAQFDTGLIYTLTLQLYDQTDEGLSVESNVFADATVPRAFANVHLAGNADGGVCFGGFCNSARPQQFECYYPAHFYGGIAYCASSNYSTSEKYTGVRWIDGKKIYRKVLQWSSLTNNKANNVAIGASGTIDTIISLNGIAWNSSGYVWAIPHVDLGTVASYSITMEVMGMTDGGTPKVKILPGKSRSATGAFMIVEYTLADDGSGYESKEPYLPDAT